MPRPKLLRAWAASGTALLGLGALACGEPLPDERLIETDRLLAVRVEVTESLTPQDDVDQAPRAQALPLETVRLEPFFVDPAGPVEPDSYDPVWIACELLPGQGLFGCISDYFPTKLDDIEACPEVNLFELDPNELPETVSPCLIGRGGSVDYSVPLSPNFFVGGEVEVTMIASPEGARGTDACAQPFLDDKYELPDDCIYAVQRISVGPLEKLILLLQEFGVEIPDFPPPDPESIPEPDRHPRIERFELALLDDEGNEGDRVEIQMGERVEVQADDVLRLFTYSPEGDEQTYLVPVNNGESFQEDTEEFAGRWYRTWGTMLSDSSDDPESFNDWNLSPGQQDEEEFPGSAQANLFYVLRDGRAGVEWFWFGVDLLEP